MFAIFNPYTYNVLFCGTYADSTDQIRSPISPKTNKIGNGLVELIRVGIPVDLNGLWLSCSLAHHFDSFT